MKAGALRHRITLVAPTTVQDENTGEMVSTWGDTEELWADFRPLSVREFIQSAATASQITARVVIRHRDDVDPNMRLRHRGRLYNIEGVLADPDSGLDYLTLPVSEVRDV